MARFYSSSPSCVSLVMSQIRQADKQPAGEGIYSDMEFPKGLVGEPSFGRPSVWPFKPQNWHVAVPKVGSPRLTLNTLKCNCFPVL